MSQGRSKKGSLRICPRGHRYYKSSDCPTCPVCEEEKRPGSGFLSVVAAPARRALEREGIDSLAKLSSYTEARLLALHGMGPSSIPRLKKVLKASGLSLKSS